MAVRIGDLLLKEKRITPAQLQEALNYQKTNGGKLGLNLVKLGFVTDEEITSLLSKRTGVPSINLTQFEIDQSVIKLIPADTAQKYQIVPLSRSGATLTIAITDPTNVFAMDDIKFMTGYNVEPVVASETAVTDAIKRYYPAGAPPKATPASSRRRNPRNPRSPPRKRISRTPRLSSWSPRPSRKPRRSSMTMSSCSRRWSRSTSRRSSDKAAKRRSSGSST